MNSDEINISWYGRCCFLVETKIGKVLFDPYDTYCNVNMGLVEADILLSSSSWHDHGHIGASPKAHVYSYIGTFEQSGFFITGIEAKETRGTPTVIYNLKFQDFSITNFADFGAEKDEDFNKSLSESDRKILTDTNIAFVRPSTDENNIHNENALKYCQPSVIIPEHYFPKSFIKDQLPKDDKENFLKPNIVVDEMIKIFNYPVKKVNDYSLQITETEMKSNKMLYKMLRIHPQVKYNSMNVKDTP